MSGKRGRLEAQFTVPSGGWDIAVSLSGGGSGTATITAGDYFLTDFLTEIATRITAVISTENCYVNLSKSEASGTGKVTLTAEGSNLAVTWTDTEVRDILGFTGNLSAAVTYVATNHAMHVWLPDCSMFAPYGLNDPGMEESDVRQAETPAGDVFTIYGQRKTVLNGLRWDAISHARARIAGESVSGESFQQFYRDSLLGERAWNQPGPQVRLYWDSDASDYDTYRLSGGLKTFEPRQFADASTLLWTIEPGRMVLVPS